MSSGGISPSASQSVMDSSSATSFSREVLAHGLGGLDEELGAHPGAQAAGRGLGVGKTFSEPLDVLGERGDLVSLLEQGVVSGT